MQIYENYLKLKPILNKIGYALVKFYKWSVHITKQRLLIPSARFMIVFLSKKLESETQEKTLCEWKEKALTDFRAWMEELPDTQPATETASADSCDLYTLLSEFSALRQEIKMQNREQNKSLKSIDNIISEHEEVKYLIGNMTNEFSEFEQRIRYAVENGEENIRKAVERKTIISFLDIRDALIRGRTSGEKLIKTKSFLRPSPKGIDGIVEGYEMAIRRFDNALEQVNVYPVNALNKTFDPKTMRAVGQRLVPGIEQGIIIEEQLGGFMRENEVIRTAEVVVSQ